MKLLIVAALIAVINCQDQELTEDQISCIGRGVAQPDLLEECPNTVSC